MEQQNNANFVSVPVRQMAPSEHRQFVQQSHPHRKQMSGGGHRKNQHSVSSQPSAGHHNTTGNNARAPPNSNMLSNNSAQKTASIQGSSTKKNAISRKRIGSQTKEQTAASHVAVANNVSSNFPTLSLENSFKDVRPGQKGGLLMGSSQTAHQSLRSHQRVSDSGQENAASSVNQNRDVSEIVGGEGLSPINGEEQQNAQQKSNKDAVARKDTTSDEAKRKQMRQIKNLQKLQKSGQQRKKSSQFGNSNKILLMSGTKSKMMELSAAASRIIDKSMTGGGVTKGTATLIELARVNGVAPDLQNDDQGPHGASQTYNNSSKLLASACEVGSSIIDYGGVKQNKAQNKQKILQKQKLMEQQQQQPQTMMMTLSEDGEIQGAERMPVISVFDQLEEMQFMSYELGGKLKSLVETMYQHSTGYNHYLDGGEGFMVQPDTWEMISNVAKEATTDFEMIQEQLRQFFDRMQDEVSKWKRRCSKLQTKLQTVSQMPPKPMGISRSQGRHAKNAPGAVPNHSNVRITISGNGGRKGAIKQSSSLNHSGIQSKKERSMLEKSLIEIVNVYDKNRTQIYSNLEEMESRVNEFKNTREKLSMQHMGTMTTVEQEMEQLCLRSARSQKSGQNIKSGSHRSQSASKRPMNSLEASRISSRAEADFPNHQRSSVERGYSHLNTPLIINSVGKQRPRATSSGVRSPTEAGRRAHSLVPPLPIHMINKDSRANQQQYDKQNKKNAAPQQQNSARSAHSKPPPPESYRSHRSQQKSRQPDGVGGAQLSRRSKDQRSGNGDSLGDHSSQQNITGAIVNGNLVSNVMLSAVNKIGTSKFEKEYENSFEGGDATLVFDTARLQQFPDDYAHYAALESTDHKILVKQMLFMKHERELKLQAKQEKVLKEQKRREQREMQNVDGCGKKRRQHSQGTSSAFNTSNRSYRSGVSGAQQNYRGKRDVELGQILDISAIQLDSSLSEIGTIEKLKARANVQHLDAQLSEMLAVSQNISGLKTVTQKELVQLAEKHWIAQEQLRKEDRKVLAWSNDGDENLELGNQEVSNDRILVGLSREEPNSSRPVSPSQVNMQIQLPSRSDLQHFSSVDQKHQPISDDQDPSPIKQNPDTSVPHCDSFINESLVYEDFEQLTPQQVRAIQQNPAAVRVGQKPNMIQNNASAPPSKNQQQTGLFTEQNSVNVGNYGACVDDIVRASHLDPVNSINVFANATSNSDEESFLLAAQKKSLEVITERQSEFSNTMGTFARPSQRSKQSKNQSSNAKNNGTRGANSNMVNGSQASFNNSNSHIINSSRQKKHGNNQNNGAPNTNPQSFVDITDQQDDQDNRSFVSRMSRQGFRGNDSGSKNQAHVDQTTLHVNETEQTVMQSEAKKQHDSAQLHQHQPIVDSAQFTDMAAHTPLRLLGGVASSEARKQPLSQSTQQQNITRQQIAYKHLMYELRGNEQPQILHGQQSLTNLRQKQSELLSHQQESVHSSYVDNSCYIDESSLKSASVDQHLSSVKKRRNNQNLPKQAIRKPIERQPHVGQSPVLLRRSNSEVYFKNTEMQSDDDTFPVPIMFAMEQPVMEQSMSIHQSAEVAKVKIDQSQLNNLTRYQEANNDVRPDSQSTFPINNTLYNQLQRLFMQHHTQVTGIQDFISGKSSSLKFSLSKSVGKVVATNSQQMSVEQPTILKPTTFCITSLFNESISGKHGHKRTLLMLNHLQSFQLHHYNPAVGLLFSHSQSQLKSTVAKMWRGIQIGGDSGPRGLSPSTDHRIAGQSMMLKKSVSPIEHHFNNNIFLDRTAFKKSLQEGIPPQQHRVDQLSEYASVTGSDYAGKHQLQQQKYRSELVIKPQNHARVLSRETVSSYVSQAQALGTRPATQTANNSVSLSNNSHQSAAKTAHGYSGSGKLMINSTGISSANVKTGSKQINQQLLQKSLIAYQSTDFNQQREAHQKSDYIDQSIVSLSALGNNPSNSLSVISKSVERVSGHDNSMASAQSNMQRKLRLKTSKQYKVITEKSSAAKGIKRPASSMATSALLSQSAVKNVSSRQGSEGRNTSAVNGGVVNVSAITAVPTSSQFKILQLGSGGGGKGSNSSATRDQSNSSSNRLQLQSQPQITKQQLQLKLQQQQSLVSQIGNYAQGNSGSSDPKIDGSNQRGPVVKRINIKKMPAQVKSTSKQAQSGIHLRNARQQDLH